MGGGLESRCVGRVCGADGAVQLQLQGTIHTTHTTYAAALKTTTNPKMMGVCTTRNMSS